LKLYAPTSVEEGKNADFEDLANYGPKSYYKNYGNLSANYLIPVTFSASRKPRITKLFNNE